MKKAATSALIPLSSSLKLFALGKPATMLCEQPCGEARISGNWSLQPTASQELRPASIEALSLEVGSPAPWRLAMTAPWLTAWLQSHEAAPRFLPQKLYM